MEPQAILFDEPTRALDPRMTAEVLSVMTDLAADGLTMVVVTHAMQFARRVAHTVHVFGEGRVIESGHRPRSLKIHARKRPEICCRPCRRREDLASPVNLFGVSSAVRFHFGTMEESDPG